jgi:surfeit locus 1 family protein
MFRFLLKPRWIALGLFALVMTGLCVRLGFWQLDRLQGRRYFNHRYEAGMSAAPEPVEQLIDGGGDLLFRQAEASGTYDAAREVILYGRSDHGEPGNHVLTPLRLADGRAILVDRGWVPFDMDTPPLSAAAPPPGVLMVTGLLAPSEPGGTPQNEGAVTTVTRPDLERIAPQLPYPLLPYYLQLRTQTPAQSGALPIPPPVPTLDDGPHLSYALQWFAFAAIAGFGFALLVAREVRDERAQASSATEQPATEAPPDANDVHGADSQPAR